MFRKKERALLLGYAILLFMSPCVWASASPGDIPVEEEDAGGISFRKVLPDPDANGGAGETVVIVDFTQDIDMEMSAYIEQAMEDNPEAVALIIELDTPGGLVDAAIEIRDQIMNAPKGMRTIAFIHPRAISAGAFIAYACDLILISNGGTIGAATPISVSGGKAEQVEEKFVSYFRAEMASTARAKGRRGDIAEAMVDPDLAIDEIIAAGKLLTLDTAGALRLNVADGRADDMDELLGKIGLGGAKLVHAKHDASFLASLISMPLQAEMDSGALTRTLLQVLGATVAVIVLVILLAIFVPRAKLRSRLVLDTAVEGTTRGGSNEETVPSEIQEGAMGVAETYLRPAGIARIGGIRIDVITEGDFVELGEQIVVVHKEGNRVVVKKES